MTEQLLNANLLTLSKVSLKVIQSGTRYVQDVRGAREDIDRLLQEVTTLQRLSTELERLLSGPYGGKLTLSRELAPRVQETLVKLEEIRKKFGEHGSGSRSSAVHFKWPLWQHDVKGAMQDLTRCSSELHLALQIDQAALLLSIDQKPHLDQRTIAEGASFDSYAEANKPTCARDTRVEVLEQITEWISSPSETSLFWLRGMAGTGKSTISRTLAACLSEKGQLGASFFFKRTEADRANLAKFVTTIAYQLGLAEPMTAATINDAITTNPTLLRSGVQEQFRKLIFQPLSILARNDPIVIIIDALDECDSENDMRLLINLFALTQSIPYSRARILITSRPELPIRLGFRAHGGMYRELVLNEVPEWVIRHDITVFIRMELETIRCDYNYSVTEDRSLSNAWPEENQVQELVQMSVPLFIFAATVCRFISDRRCGDPETQLREVLMYQTRSQESQLDAIYLPILNNLIQGLPARKREESLGRFRRIVGTLAILARPLTTSALGRLLEIPKGTVEMQLDSLHSVLQIPSSPEIPVKLLHLSFNDFLLDPERRANHAFWIDEKETHAAVVKECLRVLGCLKQDLCSLGTPGIPRSAIEEADINASLPTEVQYACQYWIHHLDRAKMTVCDGDAAHGFLKTHFLHWIEALSLLDKASDSLDMLKTLQTLLKPGSSKRMSRLLNDMHRFLLTNMFTIQTLPLQLYSSLLVFAPHKSIVRKRFMHEIPPWIALQPHVDQQWDQCLQTLEGHGGMVRSLAISHDSSLIASGSADKSIRLWRMDTGDCVQTLTGNTGDERHVAFSADSSLIAGSGGGIIKFWRVDTGKCVWQFDTNATEQTFLAFSYDLQCIALLSNTGLISLQGENTTIPLQKVMQDSVGSREYDPTAARATFSSDSSLIVVSSRGRELRTHNTATGHCVRIFEGSVAGGIQVTISSDSKLVADERGSIRIYSVDTGELLSTCDAKITIRSITFSSDSRFLAGAMGDSTVKVWDVQKGGECLQTLRGHNGEVLATAFANSPSTTLVSAATDRTIKVWQVKMDDSATPMEKHGLSVIRVRLSPDGKFIASTAWDCIIRVWSAETGACIRIFDSHRNLVNLLYFSHDSRLLISASEDRTVRIWYATGGCKQVITGPGHLVNSVDISHNKRIIALALSTGNVDLFDVETGDYIRRLESGTGAKVVLVTFSHRSELIAAASADDTVKVWHTTGGQLWSIRNLLCVKSFAFSRDSKFLVLGFKDKAPAIWRLQTGTMVQILKECGEDVNSMAFARDSNFNQIDELNRPDEQDPTTSTWLLESKGVHSIGFLGNSMTGFPKPHICISQSPNSETFSTVPYRPDLSLSPDLTWITYKGRRVLALPAHFRRSCFVVSGSTVVLGCYSGVVLVFRFTMDPESTASMPWATAS